MQNSLFFSSLSLSLCTLLLYYYLQGQVMQQSQKGGVIMSNSALALQGVTKTQSGNYSCVASNVEGDGDSNVVELKIMCK